MAASTATKNADQTAEQNAPAPAFTLDLKGELPEVQGRGRAPEPVPADLAAALDQMVEANAGTISKTGTQKEITRFKSDINKYVAQHEGVGKPVFRNAGKNPDGSESRLATGKASPGTPTATLVASVKRLEAAAR